MREHPPLRSGDTQGLHQLIKRGATHPRHIVDQKAEPNGLPPHIIRSLRPNRPGGTFAALLPRRIAGALAMDTEETLAATGASLLQTVEKRIQPHRSLSGEFDARRQSKESDNADSGDAIIGHATEIVAQA